MLLHAISSVERHHRGGHASRRWQDDAQEPDDEQTLRREKADIVFDGLQQRDRDDNAQNFEHFDEILRRYAQESQ